jgi:hypothetical protein
LNLERDICSVLGDAVCVIAKTITPSLRPSTQVGAKYSALSDVTASDLNTYLSTPMTVITFLAKVDADIRALIYPPSATGNNSNALQSLINDPGFNNRPTSRVSFSAKTNETFTALAGSTFAHGNTASWLGYGCFCLRDHGCHGTQKDFG